MNSPQVMEGGKGAWPAKWRPIFGQGNYGMWTWASRESVWEWIDLYLRLDPAIEVRLSDGSLVVVRRKRNGH